MSDKAMLIEISFIIFHRYRWIHPEIRLNLMYMYTASRISWNCSKFNTDFYCTKCGTKWLVYFFVQVHTILCVHCFNKLLLSKYICASLIRMTSETTECLLFLIMFDEFTLATVLSMVCFILHHVSHSWFEVKCYLSYTACPPW